MTSAKESERLHRAKNRVQVIHARAGIWQDGLHGSLEPELCAVWGITRDAAPGRVREIVLLRLKRVLDEFTDASMPEIVWTAYNLGVDQPDAEAGMVERVRSLVKTERVGVSERTCTRRFYRYLDRVRESLEAPQPVLTDEELRLASGWLAGNLRPGSEPPESATGTDGLSAAIRGLRAPVPSVVRMFLDGGVCVPTSENGTPLVARLGALGDWLCVFTDIRLFAEYRASTGVHWSQIGHRTGREVVLAAAGRTEPTGVLVNPGPQRGSGIDVALPLPPDEVVRLALDC